MSDNVQSLNDAELGVAEKVFAIDLPSPPPPALSGATTRVNSSADLKPATVTDTTTNLTDKPVLDEKKPAENAVVKKEAAASPAQKKPAPSKPKWKRASRWVRFRLWYNTYR